MTPKRLMILFVAKDTDLIVHTVICLTKNQKCGHFHVFNMKYCINANVKYNFATGFICISVRVRLFSIYGARMHEMDLTLSFLQTSERN